jgi:CheY-like chemotaxis protein
MNCLFVDDDIDDQEIFSFALKGVDKPIRLISAENGYEALEILNADRNFVPDCIFLDLNMPKMNGKDCLSELRKLPWLNKVPIFIYSTSSQQRDKLESEKLGATEFVSKASSIETLTTLLNRLFEKYGM